MKNFCFALAPSFQYSLHPPPTCFQNKLHKLPPRIMNSGHNPTSPNAWTQLGWGQLFKGLTWRRVWHVQDQGTVFAPPTFRKGSTSKPLTTLRNNPQKEAEKQDRTRQKSRLEEVLQNEKNIGCSALPSQLNSCFLGWAWSYVSVKSHKVFPLLSWAPACHRDSKAASSSPLSSYGWDINCEYS